MFFNLKHFLGLLIFSAVVWIAVPAAQAGTVTLAWNPATGQNINDYIVNYGASSGNYPNTDNVGNQTSVTLSLSPGTYYCTVTAVNSSGVQSLPSAELSFVVAPSATPLAKLVNGESINNTGQVTLQTGAFPSGVAKVQFFLGNTPLGQVTSASQSVLWQTPQAGDYSLTVKSYDAAGDVSSYSLEIHIVQPSVQAVGWSAGKAFQLAVTGAPGAMQSVYVSPDLQNWTLLTTQMNTSGVMTISDSQAATQPQRFYRVVSSQ